MSESMFIDVKVNGAKVASNDVRNLEKRITSLDRQTNQSSKSIAASWDRIGRSAAQAAIVKVAVEAAVRLDALKTRLEVVEGSTEKADQRFEMLKKTANALGVNVLALVDSYSKFRASADGGTLSQEQLNDVFFKFTRATAAMKLSVLDTERVFRSLYQMASKGVVSMEELKNQLGDSLPKAMPLAAEAMEVTTQQLIKMVENGEVLAEELLPKLADAYEKEFGSKVGIASQSVGADLNRVVNSFVDVKDAVLDLLQTTGVLKFFAGLGKVLGTAAYAASFLYQSIRSASAVLSGTPVTAQMESDWMDALAKMEKSWGDFKKLLKGEPVDLTISVTASSKGEGGKLSPEQQLANAAKSAKEAIKKAYKDGLIAPEIFAESLKGVKDWQDQVKYLMSEGGLGFEEAAKVAKGSLQREMSEMDAILKRNQEDWKDFGDNVFGSIEDAIVEMAMTGKASFSDMAQSILADLLRIQIRQAIVRPLAHSFGFTGYHTGTEQVKHTGGFISQSHHSGSMRSDERIARLQVGEAVVNRAGANKNREAIAAMNAGQKIGGSGVVLNIENNTGFPISGDMLSTGGNDERKTINIVLNGINKNTSGIRDMLKGLR